MRACFSRGRSYEIRSLAVIWSRGIEAWAPQNGSAFFSLFKIFLAVDGFSSRRCSSLLCAGDLLGTGVGVGVGVALGVGVGVGVD